MNRNKDFSLTTRQGHVPHVPITWGCCPRFPNSFREWAASCPVRSSHVTPDRLYLQSRAPLRLPQKLVFVSAPAQREREHTVPPGCNRSYSGGNPADMHKYFQRKSSLWPVYYPSLQMTQRGISWVPIAGKLLANYSFFCSSHFFISRFILGWGTRISRLLIMEHKQLVYWRWWKKRFPHSRATCMETRGGHSVLTTSKILRRKRKRQSFLDASQEGKVQGKLLTPRLERHPGEYWELLHLLGFPGGDRG